LKSIAAKKRHKITPGMRFKNDEFPSENGEKKSIKKWVGIIKLLSLDTVKTS
jgi:hypothetical protein